MAAYNEVLTLDEFIMFGFECNVVSGVMYFRFTTYEPMVLGPITFMTQ
jgi:hypothetical protein